MKFTHILSEGMDARQEFWKGIEDEGKTNWDEWDRLDQRDAKLQSKQKEIDAHNGHYDRPLVADDKQHFLGTTNAKAHVAYQDRMKNSPTKGISSRSGRPFQQPNYGPRHGATNQCYTLNVRNTDDAINAANAHIEEFRQQLKSKFNADIVDINRTNKKTERAGTDFSTWTIHVNSPVVKAKIDQEWAADVANAKKEYKQEKIAKSKKDKETQRTRLSTLKSYLKISPDLMTRFRHAKAEAGATANVVENGHQETIDVEIALQDANETITEPVTFRLYVVDASSEEESSSIKYRIAFGPKPTTAQIKRGEMPAFDQNTIIDIDSDSDGETYSYDSLVVSVVKKAYVEMIYDGDMVNWTATIPTDEGTFEGEGDSPTEAITNAFNEDSGLTISVSSRGDDY